MTQPAGLAQRVAGWFGRLGAERGSEAPRPSSAPVSTLVPAQHARWGRHHGAPQSAEEIRPIVVELQRIDPLLDIQWNQKSKMLESGYYTPLGKLVDPVYEGRWEVIRHQTPNFHEKRGDYAVICTLSEPKRQDGILYLTKDGPYAPVGEWVLELIRSADAQNVATFTALRKKLWAQHDAIEAAADRIDEGEARAGLDHAHFDANYAGGVGNWQGKGADFDPSSGRIITP